MFFLLLRCIIEENSNACLIKLKKNIVYKYQELLEQSRLFCFSYDLLSMLRHTHIKMRQLREAINPKI